MAKNANPKKSHDKRLDEFPPCKNVEVEFVIKGVKVPFTSIAVCKVVVVDTSSPPA